jgi:hypothetical protein
MVGTFGMRSNIYPDSGTPSGGTDLFSDTGFDAQYQHLGDTRKLTLRSSYIYEKQSWNASYPLAAVDNPHDNLKTLNLNGAYTVGDGWTFSGGYFLSNGSGESAFYNVTDTNGNQLSTKPNTTGYVFEVDRTLTQNVLASLQYTGFTKFEGLTSNIDGIGRKPSDNNTLWFSLFFAF